MNCLNCTPISQLLSPSTGFTFGDTFTTGEAYRIYVEKTSTGQVHFEDVEADADGAVTLNMELPEENFYHENATYKLWVTEAGALMYDTVDITKGATTYACLRLKFKNVIEATNLIATNATQVL